jgi:CubicO group peptidase (beta-lactamase class C family)
VSVAEVKARTTQCQMGEALTLHPHRLSRRATLRLGAGLAAMALHPRAARSAATASRFADNGPDADARFRALDEKIEAAMARYHIPGVAVGVYYEGREHVRGYGVTNVDHPLPVDGDTLFRIGSITKTFTGTAIMRLAEQGVLNLNAPVRSYLPGLKLADETTAATVTVRQLLNHSAGWLGDDYASFGRGEDALARYVAGMQQLPQLTPLGQVFAYNNAAVNLAGRVIEAVTGMPYETAAQTLLLDPLGLAHSGFFTDALVGYNLTASHVAKSESPIAEIEEVSPQVERMAARSRSGRQVVVDPAAWTFPRSLNPTGGLISTARDQLRYARFHLGNGTAEDGRPLLSPRSLAAMRANPGPGGTIVMEIDGVCVTWWQRRTAEGVPVFQHGGAWGGQNSDLFIVPAHSFAMTILTNSTTGPKLIAELSWSGWALSHFTGLSNPPATPRSRAAAELAPYEGRYTGWTIPPDGSPDRTEELAIELTAEHGRLRVRGELDATLAFYRDDYVLATSPEGQVGRSDFVRGPDGRIAFFRDRGRLYRYQV